MIMTAGVRKVALTAHVAFSVGWLGAVAAFLALAIAGLTSRDEPRVCAACLAMDLVTRFVIAPLAVASLASGIVQSLGTTWGLFRHYWVLIKLLLTAFATILLVVHMQPIRYLADAALEGAASGADLAQTKIQLVVDGGGALIVLLVATALAVLKPHGTTPFAVAGSRHLTPD